MKAKNVPIGYARGVGRPKNAKFALLFQLDLFTELIKDSSDDEDKNLELNDALTRHSASNPEHVDTAVDYPDDTDYEASCTDLEVYPVVLPVIQPVNPKKSLLVLKNKFTSLNRNFITHNA